MVTEMLSTFQLIARNYRIENLKRSMYLTKQNVSYITNVKKLNAGLRTKIKNCFSGYYCNCRNLVSYV